MTGLRNVEGRKTAGLNTKTKEESIELKSMEMPHIREGKAGYDEEGEVGFKYKHNPSDNPKVFEDAVEDSNAVYGYRPSKTGSIKAFADDDWSDANLVKYYREKRIEYHKQNDSNIELANIMRSQGKTDEEIARAMVERRNQNRLSSYMDEEGRIIDQKKYDQALEHCKSYEYLRDKKGKSDLEIIESSIKGNAGFDACTGLYDDYYHTYKIDK